MGFEEGGGIDAYEVRLWLIDGRKRGTCSSKRRWLKRKKGCSAPRQKRREEEEEGKQARLSRFERTKRRRTR
ncbi:hypothetical protein COLO4_35903 [Corchorus olitorius]|uniref:Uncharacterized protein n=1 Tax=Corchorus olitorius TaxID=93759 RepID=A0A1R3GC53_9ROSI|nr:hypothetical protein COLO4_35903 [Corchorus olitorius]